MNNTAAEAKRLYLKQWREKNKDHLAEYNKKWRKENPDKVKRYNEAYWTKKASELGL